MISTSKLINISITSQLAFLFLLFVCVVRTMNTDPFSKFHVHSTVFLTSVHAAH